MQNPMRDLQPAIDRADGSCKPVIDCSYNVITVITDMILSISPLEESCQVSADSGAVVLQCMPIEGHMNFHNELLIII